MKPRYEIHSVSLPDAITSSESAESERRDRAAQALFAAVQSVAPSTPLEFGRTVPQGKYQRFAARYSTRLRAQIDQIADLQPAKAAGSCDQTLLAENLRKANFRDAWGNPLRVEFNPRGGDVIRGAERGSRRTVRYL